MPQRSIAISAGAPSPSTTMASVVDCAVTMRLSRVMTGNESAVWPGRQQGALAGAYLGHQRTTGMEGTARGNIGWTRQFTAQNEPPLGALRDRVCFGHGRHQCPCIGVLRSREEDIAGCLFSDAPEIHHADPIRDVPYN